MDGSLNDLSEIRHKLPEDLNAVLALRGVLGFGIFEHCLSLRAGVDFGAAGSDHHSGKRVGVPYEAADIPSKRSEFAHPDLSIIVSYISYFSKGISYDEFIEAVEHLLSGTETTQKYYFRQMLDTIQD